MNEQRIELTTDEKGLAERNTRQITGKLKCVVISALGSIDFVLKIRDLDLPIFKTYAYSGRKYFAIKYRPLSEPAKIEDYFEDYLLNDVLNIQISGARNMKVNVILRWENA